MADELLNAQDLITAKKHDTFHSEVITGKTGGVSTGANIDYATNAVTGQVQKTLPKIIDDIDWSLVGNFASGVTFTKLTDFALDGDGVQWVYTGSFPFSATAGTIPTEPTYQVVHVRDHNSSSNRNHVGAHDSIYDRRTTVAEIASGVFAEDGLILKVGDRDDGLFMLVIGGTPDGKAILDAGNGNTAVHQYSENTTIKTLGAKLNLVDDDAPYIDYMAKLYGYARCPLAGPYENFALGNPLTYGVLIASDIETKSFAVYDFGNNQVKLEGGASFIPDTNPDTSFTVQAKWKNLNIVDSLGQVFIRVDTSLHGDRIYQAPYIENININKLGSLLKADGNFGWFNLKIDGIKANSFSEVFYCKNGTGQTGNAIYNGLFQSTGSLVSLENATAQCDFYNVNIGLGLATNPTGQIVNYVGATTQIASDTLTFTNCSFEYDDTTINTPIHKSNSLTELTIIFDKCKLLHKDVAGMNARGYQPLVMEGNKNSISLVNGTREWWSRFAGAQGVYLKMISGILKECDLRYEALDIGTSWSRVFNINSKFPMASNANITFTKGTYTVENNRLVVAFLGTAQASLVSGDTLYNFANIPTFLQNIVHVGDYKIRAQASSGSIVAREAIPSGSQISGNLIIDLA